MHVYIYFRVMKTKQKREASLESVSPLADNDNSPLLTPAGKSRLRQRALIRRMSMRSTSA